MNRSSKIEKLLCIFLIICPILDVSSFIFRTYFGTSFSLSTFIRPIIPIIVAIYIFFKDKIKLKLIIAGFIYVIYGVIHLYIFKNILTGSSFSTIIHEAQYIINYTYMILNLFIYTYIFLNKDTFNLKKSIFISISIYMLLIFVSIFTNTSTNTYLEGMGSKGWFETGNSLSAILILSLYVLLPLIKNKKIRIPLLILVCLMGIYLTMLIGTRVGLFGFVLTILLYIAALIFCKVMSNMKINKKVLGCVAAAIVVVVLVIGKFGSSTLERRKFLKEEANQNIDMQTGEVAHITVDLLKIKESIDNNTLEENYLSEPQKQALLALYKYANEKEIVSTDRRMQELVYNIYLVKYQQNPITILFGNGHLASYAELILEMETIAILLNFGIVGFVLYIVPFLVIFICGIYIGIKNIKKIDVDYVMLLAGSFLTFGLSTLSGSVFFNSSSMMVIIVIHILLINKILEYKNSGNVTKKAIETNTKKKVVFGITNLEIGGAERILVDLCNELCDDYDITIFTVYGKGELQKELFKNIKVKSIFEKPYNEMNNLNKKFISLKLLLSKKHIYNKYIKDNYDVEIAFLEGIITNLFCIKNKNSKKIAFVHTDISLIFGTGLKSKLKENINKEVYKKYDKIIFGSKDSLEKFEKAYDIDTRKMIIHNYINIENIIKKSKENVEFNRDESVSFLSVSRLVEAKALDRLIKVHAQLIRDAVYHKVYVIGEGPLREELESLIQKENVKETFILLGKKENPYPYMLKSDYICSLSYFEGYGMTIEEAKILNKYVIITDTAAREAVEGYTKVIVVNNDEEGVYDGIKELIVNKDKYLNCLDKYNYDNVFIIKTVKKLIEGEI